jgi:uncharacterized protein (DUF2235 family)
VKNIAFFSDGTWDEPDVRKTNVFRLYDAAQRAAAASGFKNQVVGYDPGIGRGRLTDVAGATGWGISQNVRDAYRFIVEHYEPGDRIFVFGFSRGAYTARSTAGLIRKSGVLQQRFRDKLDDAFALYRHASKPREELAHAFRATYAYGETPIHFVGVWDTVGCLGIPGTLGAALTARLSSFHDVELSSLVCNAFHALALDERRLAFRPALWYFPVRKGQHSSFEQRWFPGSHSDIGGGYPNRGLSDRPLRWMADRALACDLLVNMKSLELAPNLEQRVGDSQTWLYRALGNAGRIRQSFGYNAGLSIDSRGELTRTVCADPGYACVLDESIAEKEKKDPSYKPSNAVLKACPAPVS